MLLEFALFSVLCIFVGALLVKVYEWRQDIWYGPYMGQRPDRKPVHATPRSAVNPVAAFALSMLVVFAAASVIAMGIIWAFS